MIYLILIFALLPSLVSAEPNIPTIVLTERLMLYSFVLIVGLEAWILCKLLPDLQKKQSFFISLKANLLTTFITVPVVWGIWVAILSNVPQSFYKGLSLFLGDSVIIKFLLAPWIGSEENLLLAEWMMVPIYFIASYYGEYLFSRKKLKNYPAAQTKKVFLSANLCSYLMIMAFETAYQVWLFHYKASHPEAWNWW